MPSPIRENRRDHNHDPDLMDLDRVAISVKSHRLLHQLLSENPKLEKIMRYAKTEIEALIGVRTWVLEVLADNQRAIAYYRADLALENPYEMLSWKRLCCNSSARLYRSCGDGLSGSESAWNGSGQ